MRRKTKPVYYGDIGVGGDAPITVQSMTNTDTRDVSSTVKQIKALTEKGCDIIRVAVPDMDAAKVLNKIKKQIDIPLIADIHFDYRLAIEAVNQSVDGLRINPGNIGSKERVKEVVKVCKEHGVPIRIGVNSGSIGREYLRQYGGVNETSMVQSALDHIKILEDMDFTDIVVSLKASDVRLTINAYKKMAEYVDYPFHVGITEAGTMMTGTIKSSIGIGSLLLMGLADTIRVSLTENPIKEVEVGRQILNVLGLRRDNVEIISCPTCGRTEVDLIKLVKEAEEKLKDLNAPLKVAIMGCVVNGPGEAREADIGIAAGKGVGLIFSKGKIIKKVKEEKLIDELIHAIKKTYGC
ncbi:flavodoxin-dependent (E)-4-hydroxy-3-methylbut-2-enyl-diphosphate synthase [Caldisalinibacter kiritimatiensis]|uniref:4-hydroxy-3-methylbut-2-en-1-yl diphosphate synthase (flavodoxin) n=1 Tax=Caldisalinibacter kiritimatiensis TaxID=1304284 RepID=R1CE97_9FIRM|nr:flavodoxin-dependent (E)-4-hydroxy-3-methylbut-2-enyl-diphosphate synthase [Caldisalinibacter kiritimatiensis]EOD00615.1 1-hydroxy-2-methyl-2-(E)-butenyl 4-diphosphate synthase [Caldisalinibacter kiritimatiensis]